MTKMLYFADPMCSWCWGFSATLDAVRSALPSSGPIQYIMGGLAPDSDAPMDDQMKRYIQKHWRSVAERTGADFNWDFWERCSPRRSTYPACRAVIACGAQQPDRKGEVFRALQRAFYLEARDPSDLETLALIAYELGFDRSRFETDLVSDEIERLFQEDLSACRRHGVAGFPALMESSGDEHRWLAQGYAPPQEVLHRLEGL